MRTLQGFIIDDFCRKCGCDTPHVLESDIDGNGTGQEQCEVCGYISRV